LYSGGQYGKFNLCSKSKFFNKSAVLILGSEKPSAIFTNFTRENVPLSSGEQGVSAYFRFFLYNAL
jgi:hypothetical protein